MTMHLHKPLTRFSSPKRSVYTITPMHYRSIHMQLYAGSYLLKLQLFYKTQHACNYYRVHAFTPAHSVGLLWIFCPFEHCVPRIYMQLFRYANTHGIRNVQTDKNPWGGSMQGVFGVSRPPPACRNISESPKE